MRMNHTMRRAVRTMVGLGLLGLAGCGGPSYVAFTQLSGTDEVPSVNTNASGSATASLEGSELTVQGTFKGLSADLYETSGSAVHVHQGATGTPGGIIFGLRVTTAADRRNGSFIGTQKLTAEQQTSYRNGQLYVNVQTTAHQGGEIRGQFIPPVAQN